MQIQENKIQEKIENKIIDSAIVGLGGRLIISKPTKDDFGSDLVMEKRGGYDDEKLHFKIFSLIGPVSTKKIVKEFLDDGLKSDKNFYLMFVYFNNVMQKVSDYVWLVPSTHFKDAAEATKSPEGNKILKFEADLDINKKNQFSKFLIYLKDLGSLSLVALESGRPIDYKEVIFAEQKIVNLESLKDFLVEARANTFASGNSPDDSPRLLGSVQMEFQKAEFFYRDIYFSGSKTFMGQEIVYLSSAPVWGMNYIGSRLGKLEESFLRDALLRLSDKCRLSQVCEYERREYKYEDRGQGDISDFSGQEKISVSKNEIYKLDYKGGLISDKI